MNGRICQSCGMTMKSPQDYGTNIDGTPNQDYCTHCYRNGMFTRDTTMEEMVETNLQYLDHWNKETGNSYTIDEARPMLRQFLPTLKRWNSEKRD
jgi:hypothetical protein